ncbi:MAG: cobalamin-dependent protein [Syntrophaceae bacterium]|nr:cobalamin-dependent protein [Syntrophaceae bacterium]
MAQASVKNKKIKVLFAILSTDIHTRGSIVVTNALKDAGMDVIYLGFRQTINMVLAAAEEEDPDIICLSTHEGFHIQLFPKLVNEMKKRGLTIPIVAGGNIQEKEKIMLESIGVTGNFGPGTPIDVIVDHIKKAAGAIH